MDLVEEKSITTWNNANNAGMYENGSVEFMKALIKQGGFDTFCDYKLITNHLLQANSILEVGAGTGRALDYFTSIKYSGTASALERNKTFYEHLKTHYGHKYDIILADIMSFNATKKYDLILCMWAMLCEFTKEEQPIVLKKLAGMLSAHGLLVVDTLLETTPLNHVQNGCKNGSVSIQGGLCDGISKPVLNCYVFTYDEMYNYAKKLKCACKHIDYKSDIGRRRRLYMLKKNSTED